MYIWTSFLAASARRTPISWGQQEKQDFKGGAGSWLSPWLVGLGAEARPHWFRQFVTWSPAGPDPGWKCCFPDTKAHGVTKVSPDGRLNWVSLQLRNQVPRA